MWLESVLLTWIEQFEVRISLWAEKDLVEKLEIRNNELGQQHYCLLGV